MPIEAWCVELERALRERASACGCPTGEDDDALLARCESLPADSLEAAVESGELLWNGALAASILRALEDGSPEACARADLPADPVIGEVAIGAPCRVFEDVAGRLDDCVVGARCGAPIGGGALRCVAELGCERDGECPIGACVDGTCARPVCATSP